jgi:type IV secretory pathway VirB10-like protein
MANEESEDYVPMSDPLRMRDSGVPNAQTPPQQQAQAAQSAQSVPPLAQPNTDHQKIKRGMPKKGIMQGILLLASVGAIAFILFPPKEKPIQSEIQQQAAQSSSDGDVEVRRLTETAEISRAEAARTAPNAATSATPATSGSAVGNFAAGQSQGAQTTLSPEEAERIRKETIVASSMDASEVQLGTRSTSDAARTQSVPPGASDSVTLLRESMKQQDQLLRGLMTGDAGKAAPVQVKSDPNQDFIQQAAKRDTAGFEMMQIAPPRPSLMEGTIITAALETGINTDLPGLVRARVTSDVFDTLTQSKLLIPRGSTILGRYRSSILVGQSRVLMATERLILPNGMSIKLLGAPATDLGGVSGIPADVDNHFWDMFKASFIIGAASLLLPSEQQQITVTGTASGGAQTGGSILGTAMSDVIKRIAERNISIGPTGTVQAGERISLILSRDVVMEPYKWR